MLQKIKLNTKQALQLAFNFQKKKKFESAIKIYNQIKENDLNFKLAQFNLGVIYDELDQSKKAIKCYEIVINIDPTFVQSYHNLGLLFYKLGDKEKALNYFNKIKVINPSYANAYNNVGIIYSQLEKYKEAIDNYILCLKYDKKNNIALNNLISMLTQFLPNINHPIVQVSLSLKKIYDTIIIEDLLQNKNLKTYFLKINKILNQIDNYMKVLNFSDSQIFRRNSVNLNCKRHHEIFNKLNLIPKFCFSCFKIQIEPSCVLDLIKLFLIFDNLKLKNNNWRKCMIELRPNISGSYKGLIFCSNLAEAQTIISEVSNKLKNNLNYKLSIKRGCSEFYFSFPNFKEIDYSKKKYMTYPEKWQKLEAEYDSNIYLKNQKIASTLPGLSISDVLTINQWLNYADLINDKSYSKIGLNFTNSQYIINKMSTQLEYRRKQFKS